jgi:hypothetical protein
MSHPTPSTFRQRLLVQVGGKTVPLASILALFQGEALVALDAAIMAVATGQQPKFRKFYLEWTKGCAKTTLIASSLLFCIIFLERPVEIRVGAGDQEQAAEARLVIRQFLRDNFWLNALVKVDNWIISSLKDNGSRIVIVTADPKTQHGGRPFISWMDEFVHCDSEDFYDALLANQAKVPDGLTIVSSNSGILGTWQHKRREYYRQSRDWFFHARTEPAPWISPRDLAELEATMPKGQFLRFFKGVWCASEESAITEDDLLAAITLDGPMLRPEPGYQFFAGVDIGVRKDHSAVVMIARDLTRRLRLARVYSWDPRRMGGEVNLTIVKDTIKELHQQFSPVFFFDRSEMALMAQELAAEGVYMTEASFAGVGASEMAQALISAFTQKAIDLFPDEALLNDIRKLELQLRPTGWKLSAARDKTGHADRGIALALALLAAKNAPGAVLLPSPEELRDVQQEVAKHIGAAALQKRFEAGLSAGRVVDDDDEDDIGWTFQSSASGRRGGGGRGYLGRG